jgi:hypothetical protein
LAPFSWRTITTKLQLSASPNKENPASPTTTHPYCFETLEVIQQRLSHSQKDLPEAYLIAIWRCVPDNDSSRMILTHNDKGLLKIFNERMENSGKDSIRCSFGDAVKTEAKIYP